MKSLYDGTITFDFKFHKFRKTALYWKRVGTTCSGKCNKPFFTRHWFRPTLISWLTIWNLISTNLHDLWYLLLSLPLIVIWYYWVMKLIKNANKVKKIIEETPTNWQFCHQPVLCNVFSIAGQLPFRSPEAKEFFLQISFISSNLSSMSEADRVRLCIFQSDRGNDQVVDGLLVQLQYKIRHLHGQNIFEGVKAVKCESKILKKKCWFLIPRSILQNLHY